MRERERGTERENRERREREERERREREKRERRERERERQRERETERERERQRERRESQRQRERSVCHVFNGVCNVSMRADVQTTTMIICMDLPNENRAPKAREFFEIHTRCF